MNEELGLAIEELRQVGHSRVWFVPILLNHCDIPDVEIGRNETLKDLQYVATSRELERWVSKDSQGYPRGAFFLAVLNS